MSEKRFSKYEMSNLKSKAAGFLNRLNHLLVLPESITDMSTMDFYYSFFSDEEQRAFREMTRLQVESGRSYFSKAHQEVTKVEVELDARSFPGHEPEEVVGMYTALISHRFYNGTEREFFHPAHYHPVMDPAHHLYDDLQQYIRQWARLRTIRIGANALFTRIADHCKTPGQWKTVFPEFVVLLDPAKQQWLSKQKARSPWPRNLERDVATKTRGLATIFAKCAVLPEWQDTNVIEISRLRRSDT